MNITKPLLALLLGSLSTQASPFNAKQVPAEANWHLHADLDNMRGTAVGKMVMEAIQEEHGKQLKAVKRMFSLNPFTDLHGVTLWGPGDKDKAAVLIHGTFDREHLTDLIGAGNEYKSEDHGGNTVHRWKDDKGKTQFGAFHGSDLVVISEQRRLVIQTLDVLDERSEPTTNTGNSEPAAFLIGLANLENIDIKGDEAKLFAKTKSLQGRFFENGDRFHCEMIVEATSNKEANRFRKVLDGIVALGELANEDIASLDLRTDVTVQGESKVHATMSIPSNRIMEAIKEARNLGN